MQFIYVNIGLWQYFHPKARLSFFMQIKCLDIKKGYKMLSSVLGFLLGELELHFGVCTKTIVVCRQDVASFLRDLNLLHEADIV